jgi:hypothetical protein
MKESVEGHLLHGFLSFLHIRRYAGFEFAPVEPGSPLFTLLIFVMPASPGNLPPSFRIGIPFTFPGLPGIIQRIMQETILKLGLFIFFYRSAP